MCEGGNCQGKYTVETYGNRPLEPSMEEKEIIKVEGRRNWIPSDISKKIGICSHISTVLIPHPHSIFRPLHSICSLHICFLISMQ